MVIKLLKALAAATLATAALAAVVLAVVVIINGICEFVALFDNLLIGTGVLALIAFFVAATICAYQDLNKEPKS